MEFIKSIIDIMKGWGATEWSFVATILIELAVILFYNKGTMIAQSKLQSYEKEIKEKENLRFPPVGKSCRNRSWNGCIRRNLR